VEKSEGNKNKGRKESKKGVEMIRNMGKKERNK